jgi:hypothetical protein
MQKIMFYNTAQVTWCRSSAIVVVFGFPCLIRVFYVLLKKFSGPQKSAALGAGFTH